MRETRSSGSVEGVTRKRDPYSDRRMESTVFWMTAKTIAIQSLISHSRIRSFFLLIVHLEPPNAIKGFT
jgi:hypothetical protein